MIIRLIRSIETSLNVNRLAAAACALAIAFVLALGPKLFVPEEGLRNALGQVFGHDFGPIWVAGRAILETGSSPWDPQILASAFKAHYPDYVPQMMRFNYPPPIMLVLGPLPALPLPVAFAISTAGGVMVCLYSLWRIVPDWRTPVLALGAPAFLQVIIYGQWSLWFAALMGFALLPVARGGTPAPWACALFIVKPTLGLTLPLGCFAARGGWRTAIYTVLIALALVGISIMVFGKSVWTNFLAAIPDAERTLIGGLDALMIHSVTFGTIIQNFGGSPDGARMGQAAWSLMAFAVLIVIVRSSARGALKAASLAAGSVMVAPYIMVYDLTLLMPAAAFYASDAQSHGWRTGDRLILILGAILPYFAMDIQKATAVPVGFLTALTIFVMIASRALQSAAENQSSAERNEQKASGMIPTERLLQHEH